jgi:hypothetical protein
MEIKELTNRIIPPSDYQHRNGFNNIPIIDELSDDDRSDIENALIDMLFQASAERLDILIVETLAYLKSSRSLPKLKDLLKTTINNNIITLILATAIFEINGDNELIGIAVDCVKRMDNKKDSYYTYKLTDAFYCLIKFQNPLTNKIIEGYTNHKDYLVSYNANRVLNNIEIYVNLKGRMGIREN